MTVVVTASVKQVKIVMTAAFVTAAATQVALVPLMLIVRLLPVSLKLETAVTQVVQLKVAGPVQCLDKLVLFAAMASKNPARSAMMAIRSAMMVAP